MAVFLLTVGAMALFCIPVIGVGFRLVRKSPTTSAKYAGVALVVAGGLPLLCTIVLWLWMDFVSN
ncbi:MAG: hypothetical protein J4G13_12905 [Dehalococcoidia bacterium]|nr:hypothetical protein [Dehalococcoidia bacterium]